VLDRGIVGGSIKRLGVYEFMVTGRKVDHIVNRVSSSSSDVP